MEKFEKKCARLLPVTVEWVEGYIFLLEIEIKMAKMPAFTNLKVVLGGYPT